MKTDLYNQEGEKIDKIDLPENIFNIKMNPDLLSQAVRYYEQKKRKPIAKTKDRSEVRGGGRKPWPQKGLGRARHGSIRSPLWRGGGVTFGPTPERRFEIKLPKKMRKKALYMTISQKVKDGEIIFLDKIEIKEPKTKLIAKIIKNLSKIKKDIEDKKIAFILAKKDEKILRAVANLKNTKTCPADSLNPYFLLQNKYLIMEKEAIKQLATGNKRLTTYDYSTF